MTTTTQVFLGMNHNLIRNETAADDDDDEIKKKKHVCVCVMWREIMSGWEIGMRTLTFFENLVAIIEITGS